jgi:hypothetical protein
VKGLDDAYIETSRGMTNLSMWNLNVCSICFGVNDHHDEPADVEPDFDKLRVIGKGLCNPQILSRLFVRPRHIHAFTRMVTTSGPESIGLGARLECLGGSGWLWTRG